MATIHVVGSGPSGAHFALTRLEKGDDVVMVDVGNPAPPPVAGNLAFADLKAGLPDPVHYFLGKRFEGVLLPSHEPDLYGIPPSKSYVLERPSGPPYSTHGFSPLVSFAKGGLAEAWTAGCYTYNDDDLRLFPFDFAELEPCYGEVARRIGVNGIDDDLARFIPLHDHLLPPLDLDAHSKTLLSSYERNRARLNDDLGFYMGRSRIATLTRDRDGRMGCRYLGRCLWGCPVGALYMPSATVEACKRFPRFSYVDNAFVSGFRFKGDRIRSLCLRAPGGDETRELPIDTLVLAAGAIGTTEIVLRSVYRETGEILCLRGLMDNRQAFVPFINLGLLGRRYSPSTYQFHLLGIGLPAANPDDYVHCQVTTLKAALLHPIIQRLPFDLATSTVVARAAHASLGVVNVSFRDVRREQNLVTLMRVEKGSVAPLSIHYVTAEDEKPRIDDALGRLRRALWRMGCLVPPGMTELRPPGASVHYAGTLPMTAEPRPWTTNEHGQSREFENLFVVDGASFPFLPAKNPTFTLMANAVRIARSAL